MEKSHLKGIYPVSLGWLDSDSGYLDRCLQVIHSGINIFQFRPKCFSFRRRNRYLKFLYLECNKNNVKLVINDHESEINKYDDLGLHVSFKDIDLKNLREKFGEERLIGISCYQSIEIAKQAELFGASYVSFGSMYKTENKKDFTICDHKVIIKAKSILNIPICAIGGINLNNLSEQIKLGPDMIALIDGIYDDDEFPKKLKLMMNKFENEKI